MMEISAAAITFFFALGWLAAFIIAIAVGWLLWGFVKAADRLLSQDDHDSWF